VIYHTLKRLFDVIVSLLVLGFALPIFLLIALWIKLDSPGPVFYRGKRVGKVGKPFRIFKFRSMVANADKVGGPSTADDDPRITRSGRTIRRFKLDELPQFINVLLGEMSIVGPRPEVEQYANMFTEEEKSILSVRPGITDWASIWDHSEGELLAGASDPEKVYVEQIRPTKIRLQLQYVREASVWTDARILALTVWTLIHTRAVGDRP
jgi:lipopolysaccharide/colanic/teichoic acid biosynthesis glycosyltransferase